MHFGFPFAILARNPCWGKKYAKNNDCANGIFDCQQNINVINHVYINGGTFIDAPPFPVKLYGRIINHILRICPVLLRYELTGYTLTCGLCVTLNRFLFGRRLLQPTNLQLLCLRFHRCGGK